MQCYLNAFHSALIDHIVPFTIWNNKTEIWTNLHGKWVVGLAQIRNTKSQTKQKT